MNIKRRQLTFSFVGATLSLTLSAITMPAFAQFERPREAKADASAASESAQPRMEMPKLLQFVSAEYPKHAQQAGLTANVILILTIDEAGNVTQADVAEPVGNGFDEAARDAALRFVFRPATRNGDPVKAKIQFKYSFTLAAAPSQAPGPASEPSSVGSLGGVLRMAGSEVPIAGLPVNITGSDGFSERRLTDEQGQWRLESVKSGRYRVSIAAAAYNKYTSEEQVVAGEATDVTYYLSAVSDQLEVTVTGERPLREVTRHTIERREIERIPGTNGDALRSIESMPGVARPPYSAGMLIVRGSYPDDTQVFVDGSGIPLIYHFVVARSVIPSELLERIDFYPGNFSAQYGRGMGGIIDVGLRSPDTSCKGPYGQPSDKSGCFHGLAALDMIEGRALLEGPLPIKGWSFAAGFRRSWLDAWIGPALKKAGENVLTLPVYYDWQLIVERNPTKDSRLSFRFIGSADRYAAVIDPLAEEPAIGGNLQFAQSFWTLQGLYEAQFAKTVSTRVMASVSRTSELNEIGTWTYNVVTHPIQYRHEFGWTLAAGVKLNAGLDVEVLPYDAHAYLPATSLPGQVDASPLVSQQVLSANESRYGLRQAVYVDAELQPYPRWRIVPGLRLDYARDTRSLDPNPRINTRYDVIQGGVDPDGSLKRRTTLKGGVGVYTQPPSLDQTNAVFGTPGLVANRSIHYSVGAEQVLTRNIDVSLEGFYKDLERLVAAGADPNGPHYTNLGSGSVIGLETLIKYKPDAWFFGWLAYTLSRSVRRDFPGDTQYLIPFDETHNLTALGSLRLGRGWELGARFRLVSGHIATPVVRPPSLPALYAADAGSYLPLQGERYSQRLPLVHQLDVRMDKHWQYRYWRLNFYVDVYNVYNNAAKEDLIYDYRFARQGYATGLPIYPNIGVRGEF